MPNDEDVIMSDQGQPSVSNTTAQDATSEPRRTDHDWQYYFPPTAPVQRLVPHSSQNLISLYNLDHVMKSVRRKDPVTGVKINKLRKSYEGKVKDLHIAGVNKAVEKFGEFVHVAGKERPEGGGMLNYSDEEWREKKLSGTTIQPPSEEFLAKLDRALQMRPGPVPEADKWKKLIGNDEQPKAKPLFDGTKGSLTQANTARSSPNLKPIQRPARAGAKRSYDDRSYVGYGEGGADDEHTEYLTEDERRDLGGLKKKRRKDNMGVSSPLGQASSYNNVGLMAGGSRR